MNKPLAPTHLTPDEQYTHISSSLIKQIAQMGRESTEKKLEQFVPIEVIAPLMSRYRGHEKN